MRIGAWVLVLLEGAVARCLWQRALWVLGGGAAGRCPNGTQIVVGAFQRSDRRAQLFD